MGIVSPKTVVDRTRHQLVNAHPTPDGGVTSEPTNLFPNWAFLEKDLDGNPAGLLLGLPEEPDGFLVLLNEPGKGEDSMTVQNTELVDLDEPTYTFDKPWVGGAPARNPLRAAQIAPPPDFDYKIVPNAKHGFQGGQYGLAVSWGLRKADEVFSTTLSEFVFATVSQGQYVEMALPRTAPPRADVVMLWATRRNKGKTTARLQAVIPVRRMFELGRITLTQWKNGRPAPNRNETDPEGPAKPLLRKVRAGGLRRGKKGRFRVRAVFLDSRSEESATSEYSDDVFISEREAEEGVHVEVTPNPQDQGAPESGYRYYVREVDQDRELVYENANEEGGVARPITPGEKPVFSGRSAEEALQGEGGVLRHFSGYSLTPQDAGIPAFDATPETPVAVTPDPPVAAGVRFVSLAYSVRGEASAPNKAKRIVVPAGSTVKVFLPDPVNYLKNSQATELDSDGKPSGWELTGVEGGANSGSFDQEAGIIRLFSNGPKTGAQTTPRLSNDWIVDRNRYVTVGGTFFSEINAGTIEALVEELNDAGAVVRTTVLKTVSQTGEVDFERRFGPGGTAYLDATVQARLVLRYSGATRDATVTIDELYATPHPGRLRRIERPDRLRDPDNADPPPSVRWRRRRNRAVGPPPKRRRRPPTFSPTDAVDFGQGVPTFPAGWTARNSAVAGTVMELVSPGIEGTHGYRIAKTTSSTAYCYLWRTYSPTDRARLGARAKFLVTQRPTRGTVALLALKSAQADGPTNALAHVALDAAGRLWVTWTSRTGRSASRQISSGITDGTLLDVELIAREAGTTRGFLRVGVGVNGSTRTFSAPIGPVDWLNRYARTVQVGPSAFSDPAALLDLRLDSFNISDAGDSLVDPSKTPPLEPLPDPDRPREAPVYLHRLDFEDGTTGNWTVVRAPLDATTTVAVQPSSAIEGAKGLRVSDTGSLTTATLGVERAVQRAGLGLKARFRIVQRPLTGSVRVMRVADGQGRELAYVSLDSAGNLYVHAQSTVLSSPPPLLVRQAVPNGTVVTLEMILSGTGGPGGFLSAWVATGGEERRLMGQPQPVDWSDGGRAASVGVGLFGESAAGVTATLDFDAVDVTEAGESVFEEYDEDGNEIGQAWLYFPEGTPKRDDLGPKTRRPFGVVPGKTYTGHVKVRHAGFPETEEGDAATPFFFTAHSLYGNPYPLGSLYGPNGATGTSQGWLALKKSWQIPKAGETRPAELGGGVWPEDCYAVSMHSPGISEGELVFQSFGFSPGTEAKTEVFFPEETLVWATLDAQVPMPPPEPMTNPGSVVNRWAKLAAIADVPEGCAVIPEFGSSSELVEPDTWYAEPTDVPERRYPHVRVRMLSSPTRKKAPTLPPGSPYLEYSTMLADTVVLPKLLRADGTEFPSGVYAYGSKFPRRLAEYVRRAPQGRTRWQRVTDRIMRLPGFTLRAHSEAAVVEIEETCMEEEFVLEAHDRRVRFVFTEDSPLEFEFSEGGESGYVLRPTSGERAGNFYAFMETTCGPVEVYEIAPMTPVGAFPRGG